MSEILLDCPDHSGTPGGLQDKSPYSRLAIRPTGFKKNNILVFNSI